MKKYVILLFFFLMIAAIGDSHGQCDARSYQKSNITRFPSGFDYVHTFDISGDEETREQTHVLSKGKLYFINVSNYRGEEKNIIVELYGPEGNMIATNYDKRSGLFWPIGYACHQSGVHTLKFEFIKTDRKCGIAVLGER